MSEPLVAKLVGEGIGRPEAALPIDINYAKLGEWLVTRQKLPKDWHKRLQVIQAKAAEAVKEVPAEVLSSLKDGADASIDYLRAVELRDKLASSSERTLFGGLTGPAATWDKIVKAYEKQYVFLGECAAALAQNVDYEIPYLRKQATRLDQQIQDSDRKAAENVKNAAVCAAKYKEECRKLGIEGVAVRRELRALAAELPGLLRSAVGALHDPQLQRAAEYYAAFTHFAHVPRNLQQQQPPEPAALLPTLFEIRAGETQPPSHSACAGKDADADDGKASTQPAQPAVAIDWDFGDTAVAAAGDSGNGDGASGGGGGGGVIGIDWDLGDLAAVSADPDRGEAQGAGAEDPGPGPGGGDGAAIDIKWDIDMTDSGAGGGGAGGGGGISIDWDIAMDGSGAAAGGGEGSSADPNNQAGTGEGAAGDVEDADGVAAARLERDGEYRSRLMDDLLELRAFLAQRKHELSGGGSELLSTALPEAVTAVDATALGAMQGAVQACLAQLTSPRFRQLLLIATSQRYLDRLEANLQRQAGAEAKLLRAAEDVRARKREWQGQLVALAPRVAALVERTRRLKALCETSMASMLGGKRTVNILGEINNVLAQG